VIITETNTSLFRPFLTSYNCSQAILFKRSKTFTEQHIFNPVTPGSRYAIIISWHFSPDFTTNVAPRSVITTSVNVLFNWNYAFPRINTRVRVYYHDDKHRQILKRISQNTRTWLRYTNTIVLTVTDGKETEQIVSRSFVAYV